MATAVGMVVIAGGSMGVLADRMLHREPEAEASPRTSALWFDCAEQQPPPPAERDAWRARRLDDLQQELGLDPAQVEELRVLMQGHGDLAAEFWDRTRLDYCQMRDQLRDDVRMLLRPDQQPRFEERLRRIDERDRARYGGGRDADPRRNKQR
jgi:hypothetical protein